MNLENNFFAINKALNNYTRTNFNLIIDNNLVDCFEPCMKAFSQEIQKMKELSASDNFIEKWIVWIIEQINGIDYEETAHNDYLDKAIKDEIMPIFKTGQAYYQQYKSYILPLEEKDKLESSLISNTSLPGEKMPHKV